MASLKLFGSTNRILCFKYECKNFHTKYQSALKLTSSSQVKVLSSFIYSQNAVCQYSTNLPSKHLFEKTTQIATFSSMKFASHMSTQSNENFQVIITNPNGASSSVSSELPIAAPIQDVTPLNDLYTPIIDGIDASSLTQELVEPTLASLDLCHWTPVGLVQMFLEYLHITHHMPWWAAITACTVVARILLIPLLVKTQKNAINMGNLMPQLQFLQAKFGEARRMGNSIEASRYAAEITFFMKEHKLSPLKNAMIPMLQAPIFLSFFLGLRAMAKAPVESMKHGGIWWATDLTIPDPYYIMPVFACGTLYIVLKMGAESGVKLENMKMAKYVLQALPVLALPFCIHFPAAVLYYWCANNFCTLAIVTIMKIKPVREYLKMPIQRPIDVKFDLPKKGFIKGVKEAIEDQKILAAIEDRRRIDDIRFQKAGTGPIPRTYSYDPTKPRPANAAAAASRKMSTKFPKT